MSARPIAVVGAPSSLGIRPYDDGRQRRLDGAPAALRKRGVVERLGARDAGDVPPPPYRDFTRRGTTPRNEAELVAYSRALADEIAAVATNREFVVVLGGDCSVVLGGLLGVRGALEVLGARGEVGGRVGLAYVDAHADFATPEESVTGSAASMCLAMAVGRGDTPLARLGGPAFSGVPLARAEDVVLLGRRDHAEPWYGHAALATSGVLDLDRDELVARGPVALAAAALERLTAPGVGGFWIHVDADVLDPSAMNAVDSPVPGGPTVEELAALLGPLACHPRALGLEVTIYDPSLDPSGAGAENLARLLEATLNARGEAGG